MKINLKSQKGAITLVVLVSMLFLTAFLMSMYIGIANKAKTSAETTKQIAEQYNNIEEANTIYDSYFANTDIIPIYTREHLEKVGSGEQITINGKIYIFSSDAYYTLKNDLDLGGYYDKTTKTWTASAEDEWTPLPLSDSNGNQYEFTGVLDGLGHKITGIYINNTEDYQGLFGTLEGTVKNLNIYESYINANDYVGSIAGKNEGTIVNCYNTGIIIGDTNVTGGYFKSITTGEQIDVWSDNVLDESAYFVSGEYTATAPKGFKISKNVLEQSIEQGMVIEDVEGNEFVWIPVNVTEDDDETTIASFYRSDWVNDNTAGGKRGTVYDSTSTNLEPCTSGYNGEDTDYADMVKSVYNNHGFYVGRFEAGIKTTENPRTSTTTGSSDMVVQRDCYPYVYVGWGNAMKDYKSDVIFNTSTNTQTDGANMGKGAVALSKAMYNGKNVGVTSTLCYAVMWDTMLDFIKDSSHNVMNSYNWGNFYKSTYTITRTTAKYTQSPSTDTEWTSVSDGKLEKTSWGEYFLTTGASDNFVAKNIYDIAGNASEWTMESYQIYSRYSRGR